MIKNQIIGMNDVRKMNYRRWGYVILGMIIMMLLGTVYSYSVFRISIEKSFGIGSTYSGFPYMTALVFYALFMLLTGKYLDQYKPNIIILVGTVFVSIGWILSSFATNIFLLTITYGMISGAGLGIVYGVPMTVVARWFPEKKGLAVGIVLIGFGLSPLITAPLARILLDSYGVMRTFLVFGFGFSILIPILSIPFKYPKSFNSINVNIIPNNMISDNDMKWQEMTRTSSFIGLYLNFIVGTMIGLMIIGMTNNIGVEYVGLAPQKTTLFMSLFAVFNGIGRPVFGWFVDKVSSKKAMLLSYGLILFAAVIMLLAEKGNEIVFIISFAIFWLNLGGWLSIAPATTLRLYGIKHYGKNYGLVFTAYGFGAISGVVTSGLLIDMHQNYLSVFYLVSVLCVIGIILTMKLMNEVNKTSEGANNRNINTSRRPKWKK